jgi:hypothetical protein
VQPNYEHGGLKPNYEHGGLKPNYEHGGLKPNYEHGGLKPNYERKGTRLCLHRRLYFHRRHLPFPHRHLVALRSACA